MAEDREAFRDLLDRIGQPYAPSWIVETPADVDAALPEIGLPAIVRPAFTLGGTGGGIVETDAATASASGPACAPARSAR